jgi:hypothetical protein
MRCGSLEESDNAETGYHPADRIPRMKDGEQMEELSASEDARAGW